MEPHKNWRFGSDDGTFLSIGMIFVKASSLQFFRGALFTVANRSRNMKVLETGVSIFAWTQKSSLRKDYWQIAGRNTSQHLPEKGCCVETLKGWCFVSAPLTVTIHSAPRKEDPGMNSSHPVCIKFASLQLLGIIGGKKTLQSLFWCNKNPDRPSNV